MKPHKHHIVFRSLGGSDDPSNLVCIDFVEHAKLHALDFVNGGPMFDFRQEGWKFLDPNLQKKVRQELSRRNSLKNPMWDEDTKKRSIENRRSYAGESNPFYKKQHSKVAKEKIKFARKHINPSRRSLPIILIHPDGIEEMFSSCVEACKKYGLSRGNLSMVLNNRSKHTRGFKARKAT